MKSYLAKTKTHSLSRPVQKIQILHHLELFKCHLERREDEKDMLGEW